jgi:predicted chitinase
MVPVREGFSKSNAEAIDHVRKHNRAYGKMENGHVYYGRGYVQLTWDYNYRKEGILNNPDKALEPDFAAIVLFKGLLDGRWNGKGKGLRYYIDSGKIIEARRTVNVLNKAKIVAGFYENYLDCLRYVGDE